MIMQRLITCSVFTAIGLLAAPSLQAAQLRVEPVLLDLTAPAAAATLTLRNDDDVVVTAQTRVFRWSQSAGKETLEPTTDVVASPPTVKLSPHADYVVRVVRVSRQPVQGEESYRVLVDQIPEPQNQRDRAINLLVRQSIPAFFRARQLSTAAVSWSLAYENDRLVVTARNDGDERLRIASLKLRSPSGQTINFGGGLVGYALGRSSMSWAAPGVERNFAAGGQVSISAMSDKGPVNATASAPVRH
jgi:fimbrial chaperone protein